MTNELGPSARALLDAARDGMSPDAAAISRVRTKVDAAIGGGVAAGSVATLAGKLGALAVVAALATGAALYLRRDRDVATVVYDEPRIVHETAPARAVAREQAPETPETAMPPMIVHEPTAAVHTVTAPRERRHIDLGREVALIDRAMAAMRSGNSAAALAAVRTHATETAGAGQLAEDAAAIEIEALCRLHDSTVDTKLEAFDKRWPESAQRARITASCH